MGSLRFSRIAFSGVLLWLLVLVLVDAQSRVEEVVALTSFRKLEELDDYNSLAPYWFTWKEDDENPCAWVGVTCTPNYTVDALDFSSWGLETISSFTPLSKLPDLRQLDMSSNKLSGTYSGTYSTEGAIPDDIGSLTQLSRLDLSNNQFVGSIPSNISACRGLQFLSLQQNSITGTIPNLSDLVHLQFLLLADNQLYGAFPSELGEMSSLVFIDISRNLLNGTIPSLLNSTNLSALLLDNNSFVGFEEPMYINAPHLQELSVSANLLDGAIPLALRNLPDLVNLNMSFNRLSGTIPSGLYHGTLGVLFSLDLSYNQLSGSIPADLVQPRHYDSIIYLSYNLLNDSIPTPTVTSNTSSIAVLDLSYNQLSGPVPLSLLYANLSLNLEYNLLSGNIIDVLAATTAFAGPGGNALLLGNNYFTGDLCGLTFQWTNWTTVVRLDLSNNNLSCRVSEFIPDPISALLYSIPRTLSDFSVAGNDFSGIALPIAPAVQADGHLSTLESLDLSNCQLEGVISGAVFNPEWMPMMIILNLSHNFGTGPVPENITKLPFLFILDLSYNELSGPLPPIPLNSSLINPSFFLGNEGLCGLPLAPCPQVFPSRGIGVQWWALLIIICGSVMIGSCTMVTWRWRVYRKLHEQDADLIRTLMKRELVTLMPLRNLKKATNNFAESEKIGQGGFGTVYKGKLNDGKEVAIKRSNREGSEKDKEQFLNEVTILSQVNHRHLVKLIGCCMENKVALLVFEFISNGTLQDHLRGKVGDGHLSWKQRLTIAVHTADALNYLHSAATSPIYHRDVKSANILLNDDLSAKVADFGISKLASAGATDVSTALQGTIGYMDPEYWVSLQLTEKSDVYSFGVVLLELISAKSPVDHQRGEEDRSLVIFASPYIHSGNLEPLIDQALMATYSEKSGHGRKSILDVGRLAMRCLEMQSFARPNMREVWKQLQDVNFEFDEAFMQEDHLQGCLNNDSAHPLPDFDHQILLSPLAPTNRSDSLEQYDDGDLELAYFSHQSSCN